MRAQEDLRPPLVLSGVSDYLLTLVLLSILLSGLCLSDPYNPGSTKNFNQNTRLDFQRDAGSCGTKLTSPGLLNPHPELGRCLPSILAHRLWNTQCHCKKWVNWLGEGGPGLNKGCLVFELGGPGLELWLCYLVDYGNSGQAIICLSLTFSLFLRSDDKLCFPKGDAYKTPSTVPFLSKMFNE